jgi:hypothetical protein
VWRVCRGSFALAVLSSLSVGACHDGGGGAGGGPVGFAELESRFKAAACQRAVACKETPDLATCMASIQEEPGYVATIESDIASGKLVYDGAAAESCIEAIESVYGAACTRTAVAAASGQSFTDSCAGVFAGTVGPGGACFFSEECADGGLCEQTDLTCPRDLQCCAGTCAAQPAPIPVGGDCSAGLPNQSCASGSYCNTALSGASMTCVVPSTVVGTPCSPSTLCGAPLFCNLDSSGTGTCQPPAATGAPCNARVGNTSCDSMLDACDATSATCTPRAAVGGTCDVTQNNCVLEADCVGSTCVARLQAGQVCTQGTAPYCLGSLNCDSTTNLCTLAPVGGACQ